MHALIAVIALAAASHRNPFAYVTKPVAPKQVKKAPVVVETPAPVVVEVQAPVAPVRPDPPRFPYRFIGMFGYAENPIIAFASDDRIITVQAGATIDSQFVIRQVGLESVEIGFVNDERTVRVRLGDAR